MHNLYGHITLYFCILGDIQRLIGHDLLVIERIAYSDVLPSQSFIWDARRMRGNLSLYYSFGRGRLPSLSY